MWKPIQEVVHWWRPARLRRCDPYLVWADATTAHTGVRPHEDVSNYRQPAIDIGVLVELHDPADYIGFLCDMGWSRAVRANKDDQAQPHRVDLDVFLPNGFEQWHCSRFVTGLVSRRGLRKLVRAVLSGRIRRFCLQLSRRDLAEETLARALALWQRAQTENEPKPHDSRSSSNSARSVHLGVIDDMLPFVRPAGVLPMTLWDQGWEATFRQGAGKDKPSELPCPPATAKRPAARWASPFKEQHAQAGLRGYLAGRMTTADSPGIEGAFDAETYLRSGYGTPAPRQSHGAAVLGLMAPWLASHRPRDDRPGSVSGLTMVQLPSRAVNDTSGGSLAMHVLDGLRFVLWQAGLGSGLILPWKEPGEPAQPCPQVPSEPSAVINVSYGVQAGAHDGTSMLEQALVELLDRHPSMHVVLPAGNAHRAGAHARRMLAAAGERGDTATVTLRVLPDNAMDTFVEFWLPRHAQVQFTIAAPGVAGPCSVGHGEAWIEMDDHNSYVQFAAIYPPEVAQSTVSTMMLLAIGPTRSRRWTPESLIRGLNGQIRRPVRTTPGLWTITMRNLSSQGVAVDARVERGDTAPDRPGGSRQAFFPDSCSPPRSPPFRQDNATPEDTLNGIATLRHPRAHVVGAMRTDGALSDYTAADGDPAVTEEPLPSVVAPADWSLGLPGLRTMGFRRGAISRIDGTSAACAVYARALAESLAQGRLPPMPPPPEPRPEIDCVPERQPAADREKRGFSRRGLFPYEVQKDAPWRGIGQWPRET